MKERDYSELEGRKVKFELREGRIFQALVAGCDYDLGITLVSAENKHHYLYCLLGPLAPHRKKYNIKPSEQYPAKFYSMIRMIKKGKVKIKDTVGFKLDPRIREGFVPAPSAETCPFAQ